jgi:hypothetical protein
VNIASADKNSRLKANTGLHHPFVTRLTTEAFDESFLHNYYMKHCDDLSLDDRADQVLRTCIQALV